MTGASYASQELYISELAVTGRRHHSALLPISKDTALLCRANGHNYWRSSRAHGNSMGRGARGHYFTNKTQENPGLSLPVNVEHIYTHSASLEENHTRLFVYQIADRFSPESKWVLPAQLPVLWRTFGGVSPVHVLAEQPMREFRGET